MPPKTFKGNQFGPPKSVLERFNSKYKIVESGCWEWQAYRNKKGYGTFDMNGTTGLANRASYMLFIGGLERDMLVCHKCDNPSCVNPFHLFKGTNQDNRDDAVRKGRKPLLPHPSIGTYSRGCRCEECKEAKRQDRLKYKKSKP